MRSFRSLVSSVSCLAVAVAALQPAAHAAPPETHFAGDAALDAYAAYLTGGRSFFMAGIATDLQLVAPGHFAEKADGTATLNGTLQSASNPSIAFLVSMAFSGRVDAGSPPPPGSPKLDLLPAAYAGNGGPVDPATWRYYPTFSGTLSGLGAMSGAQLALARMGPAWQVGLGASGLNAQLGMSGWMTVTTLQQPSGGPQLPAVFAADGNMNLRNDGSICVEAAPVDATHSTASGLHALWLPGAGDQFVFDPPGTWTTNPDGSAKLTGQIQRAANPSQKFLVDVDFSGLLVPGMPGHAPAGSPKKELKSSSYVENGGPVNPATWIYYTSASGVLTGAGAYAGAKLTLTRTGPAFQMGLGANGKNAAYGGSGWFDFFLVAQPGSGGSFPSHFVGDINVDLRNECVDDAPNLPQLTVANYGAGCSGTGGAVPALALTGSFVPGGQALLSLTQGQGGAPAIVFLGLQQASLPLSNGCQLLVAPILPISFGPVLLTGSGPGSGRYDVSFTLPLTFTPGSLTLQGFVDEGAGLYSNTNGVQLSIQ